jgi:sodium transport system ATP-binding protein
MIRVAAVTKRMGSTVAVKDVSFDAPDGTISGLVGPNGAGKTTTLRLIAGVLSADSGSIRVDSVDPNVDIASARRLIGALLDHTGLYGRLTARETLLYFARLRHLPRSEVRPRVNDVIENLGLARIADRRTGGFSQGELLKVALGCALLHKPKHILLDEPTNGLDPEATMDLRATLKTLRGTGVCIIFSSHVLSEVEELCDRIVVLANGTVATQGTVAAVCSASGADSLEPAFLKLTRR